MDINSPGVRIQVLIDEQTTLGKFTDALYFSPSEFAAKTAEQVTTLKTARVNNWKQAVQNPPPVVVPTKAELIVLAKELHKRLDAIYVKEPEIKQDRIDELTDKPKVPK